MVRLMRRLGRTWAPVVGAIVLAMVGPPVGAMTAIPFGSVVAVHSAKCLAIQGGVTSPGALAVQATCRHAGSDEWQLQPNGNSYQLIDRLSGLCLSITGSLATRGANAAQNACVTNSAQLWTLAAQSGGYALKLAATGMCLTVAGYGQTDNTSVVQWTCDGSANQTFVFERHAFVLEAPLMITGQQSGQCAGAAGASAIAGTTMVQNPCTGAASTVWLLRPIGQAVSIVNGQNGQCLDVTGASQSPGASAIQWPCSGNTNQQWRLQAAGNAWRLVAVHSGQCLIVLGGTTVSGAQLVQSPCAGVANELWSLHQPALQAKWSGVLPTTIVPVAAANLPDGRLLTWAAEQTLAFSTGVTGVTYTELIDPVGHTDSLSLVTATGHDMFCPGTSVLPDGRVLVNGGIDTQRTSLFDPLTGSWSDGGNMHIGRGYEGTVLNADGSVLTLGGSWSGDASTVRTGELWRSGVGWKLLSGVPSSPVWTADISGVYRSDNHLWLHVLSSGRLLHAGPSRQMNWIVPSANNGAGSITSAGLRGDDADSMNGNATVFDADLILKTGGSPNYDDSIGGTHATPSAQLIDARTNTLAVRRIAPMAYARSFANSVVLPNGQVVVVGGETIGLLFSDDNSVLVPEIWDPTMQVFERLPAMATPRNYHSVALLLPDGRVWAGGGGLCGSGCAANHPNYEILTPPYLLNADGTAAARPSIWGIDRTTVPLGGTLQLKISTPVTSFALIRLASVTHSLSTDQRRIAVSGTTVDGWQYAVTLPSDPGVVVPGYYMLFALDAKGVPSMSQTVRITSS